MYKERERGELDNPRLVKVRFSIPMVKTSTAWNIDLPCLSCIILLKRTALNCLLFSTSRDKEEFMERIKVMFKVIVFLAAAAAAGSCSQNDSGDEEQPQITLSHSEITLAVIKALPASASDAESSQLTVDITPADLQSEDLDWSVDDQTTALVDAQGNVTAVSPGTAVVTVVLGDNLASDTCIVNCSSALLLQGTIEDTLDPMSSSVTDFSHSTGVDYYLADEMDRSVVFIQDSDDDAVLELTAFTPSDDDLYSTADFSPDLTFSDTSARLLQLVVITSENTSDGVVFGDVDASPLEYYTYMYSSVDLDISGTDSQLYAITYSNVSLERGWNILHVENPMNGSVTLTNTDITDPAWFMIDAP